MMYINRTRRVAALFEVAFDLGNEMRTHIMLLSAGDRTPMTQEMTLYGRLGSSVVFCAIITILTDLSSNETRK